jgi:hypothetical protein
MDKRIEAIEFGLATPRDFLDLIDFHNSYYGENIKLEDWLWEFQRYEPSKMVFALAEHHNKVVATQGMLPIYMRVKAERVLSGKSESSLCLQTYRGTNTFRDLYEYAVRACIDRGMHFLWGFTDAVRAFERIGFNIFQEIEVLTRPGNVKLEVFSILQGKLPLWRVPLWHRFGSVTKLLLKTMFVRNIRTIPQIKEETGYKIEKGSICDQHLRELYERVTSKYKNAICIECDQSYLSWRIREHPVLRYDEYQVYQGAKLRAYAFVVLSDGIAHISDFLSEDSYATSLLLHTILKDYAKKVGRFQFLGNPRDLLAEDVFGQLHKFGFSVIHRRNFVVRDLIGSTNDQLLDIRNWHITGLWSEGYKY